MNTERVPPVAPASHIHTVGEIFLARFGFVCACCCLFVTVLLRLGVHICTWFLMGYVLFMG